MLEGYERVEVTGVLRNRGSGWEAYEEGGHVAIGIDYVENNNQEIIVHFSEDTNLVSTFVAVPDETYAVNHGVSCGSSVSTKLAKIRCKKEGVNGAWNPNNMTEHWGNIWVFGVFYRRIPDVGEN